MANKIPYRVYHLSIYLTIAVCPLLAIAVLYGVQLTKGKIHKVQFCLLFAPTPPQFSIKI